MTKANILIVEDEAIIATVIAKALKKFAYEVIDILPAGEAAVTVALQKKPDLILMDIRLQGAMDGITAVELIQEHLDIPVIYLTAYASEQILERAKKTRPFGYLVKPFQDIELQTSIEMALYKHSFEMRLKMSEAKFRAFFENSRDTIYIADAANRLLEINPAGIKSFGHSQAEMLNSSMENLYQNPAEYSALLGVLHEKNLVSDFEVQLQKKDGTPMACLQTTQAQFDKKGGVSGFQGIIHDITELKRAATERKNLEAQFLQAQKMEALGQLAGGVAHDFNNLLTGIDGFAKLALEQLPQGSATCGDLAEVLNLIKQAEALTHQLLTFSRKQKIEPKVLNINWTIEEMLKMLGRLIGKNIELVFILAPDLGEVNIDPGQLEQMLANLTINARDAMPDGGKLTIETANIFLDQDYARANLGMTPGAYVMLAVSDTGCGIDENTRQHLFEPFFTTKPQGTGLGLSTVYGIVKQFKGSIRVESKPDQGTTLRIYLPKSEH